MSEFGYVVPPDASSEELARLAAHHPDLWPVILQHPNLYPDLQQWIEQQQWAEQQQLDTHTPSADLFHTQAQTQPVPFAPKHHSLDSDKPPRRTGVLAAVIAGAVVIVLGIATTTVLLTKTWPFNPGGPFGSDTHENVVTKKFENKQQATSTTKKEKNATRKPARTASLPKSIPDCPANTILLAWGEFSDGWVLICGVDKHTPSFAKVQLPSQKQPLVSTGANDPDGKSARAAVKWDEHQRRFTADLTEGKKLTIDYDMGTLIVHGSDSKTYAQTRFVRYLFVPVSKSVRTLKESAKQSGAFDVQAPDESAEDQLRYMIEVLEKAYTGRALVKEALPKLMYCNAPAGGYADTISAMMTVRDNRAELLRALDAMPVDQIPEGDLLLNDLREAIEYSHQANVEYVAWAEAANAQGCASLSALGQQAAELSDPPKERFAERWNRVIAPAYGVRTFDAWFI